MAEDGSDPLPLLMELENGRLGVPLRRLLVGVGSL